MTIYLLFAIGLKGGAKLDGVTFGEFWKPLAAALVLSLAIPLWSYAILRKCCRLDGVNSAAMAAHYGSVSAVTFGEALPTASPAIYLTSSLAVTFPFNVVVGIPLYFSFARWIAA
jgi:hypothetical protein